MSLSPADKYPLVQKTLAAQKSVFASLMLDGTDNVLSLERMQTRAFDLIEQNVARSAAEKEALMVGLIHRNSGGFALNDRATLSPETETVFSEIHTTRAHEAMPRNLAQLHAALAIAALEDTIRQLGDGSLSITPAQAQQALDLYEQEGRAEESLWAPALDCPGLQKTYDAVKTELLDLFAQRAASAPVTPRQRPPQP